MEFTKEELRIIETLAYSGAVNQSRLFVELSEKLYNMKKKPNEDVFFKKGLELFDKLMTISAKAGKMSEIGKL
jgi:hypothetical protein